MYRDASRVSARGFRNFSLQWFGGCGGGDDDDDDDDDDDARMRRRDANARATLVATVIGASTRDADLGAGDESAREAGKQPVTSTERVYFFGAAADVAFSLYISGMRRLIWGCSSIGRGESIVIDRVHRVHRHRSGRGAPRAKTC
jgi:hypothetical protein